MEDNENQERTGVDRRTLIRRSAVMGGAMVWAVPTVQTLAGPAFAAGSPLCDPGTLRFTRRGRCVETDLTATPECCSCIARNGGGLLGAAICYSNNTCMGTTPRRCTT